eukprot:UN27561
MLYDPILGKAVSRILKGLNDVELSDPTIKIIIDMICYKHEEWIYGSNYAKKRENIVSPTEISESNTTYTHVFGKFKIDTNDKQTHFGS